MRERYAAAVIVAAVAAFGCSGSEQGTGSSGEQNPPPENPPASTEKTCADACASVYACAAHFGYDLTDTLGTQSDCVTKCEAKICGPTYASSVRACIVSVPCTGAIDTWGATTVACDTTECAYDLPLPVGSCNDRFATGRCQDYLGIDASSASTGKWYCTGPDHGTWVPICSTENRKAVCLYEYGNFGRIVYYTSFAGDLAVEEAACRQHYGFKSWTVY
jgi:hypothetical protein